MSMIRDDHTWSPRTETVAHGRTRGPHDRNLLPPCISQYSCPFIPTLGIVVVSAWTLRSAMQRREAIRSCNGRRFLWYGARSGSRLRSVAHN
jgi:hypothetical protein